MLATTVVDVDHLRTWLSTEGPAVGLTISPKGLAGCWAEHPIARHEVTGLFLAWSALSQAFNPTPPADDDPYPAQVVPGPRDFLDLSNASAAAVARAIAATANCARAGSHINQRTPDDLGAGAPEA